MGPSVRLLLLSCLITVGQARAEKLEDRVVLASLLAHSAIIEAQSKDVIFFQHCEYFPATGEVHDREIPADHLFNCREVGPMLPNRRPVRDFLEARFTDALNEGLVKLDETGYAKAIVRDTAVGAVSTAAVWR